MQKRFLGTLEVSALGYGAMGLSHAYGAPLSQNESVNVLKKSYDLGYTFIDTAEVYGPFLNEEAVGEAFYKIRDKVQIATKCGIRLAEHDHGLPLPDNDPKFIRASLEGSLKRLKTDHIDLYYLHRVDPKYSPEETAEVFKGFIKEGKILHYGLSEVGEDYLRRANAICKVTAIQNRYSLMYRDYEKLFKTLEELNIGFVAFSPLANGFLSGAYQKGSTFDEKTDYRSRMVQFKEQSYEQNQEFLDLIKSLSTKYNVTLAQISLAYLLAKRPYIVPMPGSRHEERMAENAKASEIALSAQDVAYLAEKLESIKMSEVFSGTKK